MIVKKRQFDESGKGYLIISYRRQRERTSMIKWFMVVLSVCFLLFGILAYEGSFLGIRGFMISSGIYLTYASLSIAINENQVWFRDNELVIKYTPLPKYQWGKNIELGNIKKAMLKVRSNSRTPTIPWVDIELRNGKTKKLFVASNVAEAEEIAEEINQALREWQAGAL